MKEAVKTLKKYYGYDSFRTGQLPLIENVMKGKDVLGIMPTGGGKSICYQIPGLLMEGTTIVVSPLIALMKDQVDGLKLNGIEATFLNSSLSSSEFRKRCSDIYNGMYKLVYVAPERLLADTFIRMCSSIKIGMLAIDEAHCISQWGHDFRPSYSDIPVFIHALPTRPTIGAFTATATPKVTEEIMKLLELKAPFIMSTGFDRTNLKYQVIKPQNKLKYIKDWIHNGHEDEAGIIYCSTRKSVEQVEAKLQQAGFHIKAYHGGMTSEERSKRQDMFMKDEIDIMVATNAFGMGIDKPDIRYVIHYNMPQNMEAYYQEAGRAGRDGEDSDCLLMYSPADIVKQKLLIQQNNPSEERLSILRKNLQWLVDFCHTDNCLRREVIRYFGETATYEKCGTCGNCTSSYEDIDMTQEAQKIMSCIYRMKERYGITLVIQVLRGSKVKRILDLRLHELSTYGILKDMSEGALREMMMNLIARDYLYLTTDEFPVVKLTKNSKAVLRGEETVYMRRQRIEEEIYEAYDEEEVGTKESRNTTTKGKRKSTKKKGNRTKAGLNVTQQEIYDRLSEKRAELAEKENVPRFMIFSNATLEDMARLHPRTLENMMDVKGVGEKKLASYGEDFLEELLK